MAEEHLSLHMCAEQAYKPDDRCVLGSAFRRMVFQLVKTLVVQRDRGCSNEANFRSVQSSVGSCIGCDCGAYTGLILPGQLQRTDCTVTACPMHTAGQAGHNAVYPMATDPRNPGTCILRSELELHMIIPQLL